MSLCIIKYTYTQYVGVDIEKYTRGLFEYVKEAFGEFQPQMSEPGTIPDMPDYLDIVLCKKDGSIFYEMDIQRRAINIPLDFQLEGLVLEIDITNCDGTKYKKIHHFVRRETTKIRLTPMKVVSRNLDLRFSSFINSQNNHPMTYEEFKQLAEHPQHRDVPAIFKLEVLETEELEEKKRSHYPKYKVNTYCPQAFTTTLEEAERLMHQDVLYRKKMKEEDDYPLDTFCYYISEIPMGLLHYDRECLSERVYDGEGKLIDRSYCCSRFSIYYPGVCDLPAYNRHPDETFRGRNAEQIRFQKGDIVEVYRGNEVKLAIVVGTPLTTEWIWERNQAAKDKRGLDELPYDETDDSYTVIDGPGYEYHDHVPSLYVFAPHYHVPLYLQRRFKGYLEKAEKKQKEEEEKDRIFRQAHDCCFSNKEQIEKSEKCGCFFCGEIFSPSEITDYLPDEPPTAECPFCHTDSVIGDASGFPITKDFLKKMRKRYF